MSKVTRYTSEFREEAVKIAQLNNQPLTVTAQELGINYKTFCNWVREAMNEQSKPPSKKSKIVKDQEYLELQKEIQILKKQLKRVEMERDFLKKASAYFASQDR